MDEDVQEEIPEENGLSRFYTDPNFDNNRKKEYFKGNTIIPSNMINTLSEQICTAVV